MILWKSSHFSSNSFIVSSNFGKSFQLIVATLLGTPISSGITGEPRNSMASGTSSISDSGVGGIKADTISHAFFRFSAAFSGYPPLCFSISFLKASISCLNFFISSSSFLISSFSSSKASSAAFISSSSSLIFSSNALVLFVSNPKGSIKFTGLLFTYV